MNPSKLPQFICLALALLVTSGCQPTDTERAPSPSDYEASAFPEKSEAYRNAQKSPDSARAFLSDTTFFGTDLFHGAQIEYLAADGKTFLWYPGNSRPVQGEWKIQEALFGPDICFRYGPNTRNPITGSSDSSWYCDDFRDWRAILKGDPFNLASGKLPFVLPKRSTYKRLYDIRVQAGLPGPYNNLICAKSGPC